MITWRPSPTSKLSTSSEASWYTRRCARRRGGYSAVDTPPLVSARSTGAGPAGPPLPSAAALVTGRPPAVAGGAPSPSVTIDGGLPAPPDSAGDALPSPPGASTAELLSTHGAPSTISAGLGCTPAEFAAGMLLEPGPLESAVLPLLGGAPGGRSTRSGGGSGKSERPTR